MAGVEDLGAGELSTVVVRLKCSSCPGVGLDDVVGGGDVMPGGGATCGDISSGGGLVRGEYALDSGFREWLHAAVAKERGFGRSGSGSLRNTVGRLMMGKLSFLKPHSAGVDSRSVIRGAMSRSRLYCSRVTR